ncbi:hypothetical protein AB6F56_08320 [Providencia huaxiensis]|uniref:hypothetical protein n=1 Tax=Providencia huaxiensis TaxID=2027290 RepID=UPI0034DCF701
MPKTLFFLLLLIGIRKANRYIKAKPTYGIKAVKLNVKYKIKTTSNVPITQSLVNLMMLVNLGFNTNIYVSGAQKKWSILIALEVKTHKSNPKE